MLLFGCISLSWADGPFRTARYDGFKVLSPKAGSIVMIGNSITDMHIWQEVFRDADGNYLPICNRGNSGSYSTEQSENIESYLANGPAKVFLMIGTNDIATSGGLNLTPEQVLSYVKSMVHRIHRRSPATHIYLYPILNNNTSNRVQATWLHYNQILKAYIEAAEDDLLTFVDIYDALENLANGGAWSNDRLHPNAAAYKIWCHAILPYLGEGVTSVYDRVDGDLTSVQRQDGLSSMHGGRATMFSVMPITDNDILIFGDGEIKTAEWWELLGNPNVKNRGTGWNNGGDIATTSKEVDATWAATGADKTGCPKAIFLYTATSDVTGSTDMSTVQTSYSALVNKLKEKAPNAKIYVMAIHPRYNNATLNTGRITTFNTWLQNTLAAGDDAVRFVDTYTPLLNGNNADGSYVNSNQYLLGRGSVLFANAMAAAYNVDFSTDPMVPVSVEAGDNNDTMATRRNTIGTAITAGRDIVAGTRVGEYTEAGVAAFKTAEDAAFDLLAHKTITAEEVTAAVSALRSGLEVIAPTSENTADRYFRIYAPNRGSRYLTNNGSGTTMTGLALSRFDNQVWQLEARTDGSFDVKSVYDGSYMAMTSPITTTASQPASGWSFAESDTPGLFIITSGTHQLNQQNESPYRILNWGGGGNTSDDGCKYKICEVEEADFEHMVLQDGLYYTIAGYVARNGGTTNYVYYDGTTRSMSTTAPQSEEGVWKAVKVDGGWKFESAITAGMFLTYEGADATGAVYTIEQGVATGCLSMKINGVWSASSETGAMGGAYKASGGTVQSDAYNWSTDWIIAVYEKAEPKEAITYSVNKTTGSLWRDNATENQSWNNTWKSYATPQLTFACPKNNMTWNGDNIDLYTGQATSSTYTITAPASYKIKAYSFKLINHGHTTAITMTFNGQSYTTSSTAQLFEATDVNEQTVAFTLSGTNGKGITIYDFTVTVAADETPDLLQTFITMPTLSTTDIPYRIPAIGQAHNGDVIAVADYRYSRKDIGMATNGKIDLKYRIKDHETGEWGEILTLAAAEGTDAMGKYATAQEDSLHFAYGDPCIVCDAHSSDVVVTSCSGNVSFPNGTRLKHQGWAYFLSHDNGQTWEPVRDISPQIFRQFDKRNGSIRAMFIGSGKITQSTMVKVGSHYRLYCAALVKLGDSTNTAWSFYSDDFGSTWHVLGGVENVPISGADEPKSEELPDGSVLLSTRIASGRKYNIYHFTDIAAGEGYWETPQTVTKVANGYTASSNACNGETLLMPVTRTSDNAKVFLLLQSVPFGPTTRANVGINYKELADFNDFRLPSMLKADTWDGTYQVSSLGSAYSTMCLGQQGEIHFLYEEETYCGISGGGYSIVYKNIPVDIMTNNAYVYRSPSKADLTAYLQAGFDAYYQELATAEVGNYVGQISAAGKTTLDETMTAYTQQPTLTNYCAYNTAYRDAERVALQTDQDYLIMNSSRGGACAYAMSLGDGKMIGAATDATSAEQHFRLVAVAENEGQWYLQNVKNGAYYGKLGANETQTPYVTSTADAGTWIIQSSSNGLSTFFNTNKTGTNSYIHLASDNVRLVPWSASDPSHWYILPVEPPTGLTAVEAADAKAQPVYQLNGIRVSKMRKGTIYVQGDRKFLAK